MSDSGGGNGAAVSGRAAALPWGADTWAVVLQPGAGAADLIAALGRLPEGACFDQTYGDVDLLLVYRTSDGSPRDDGAGTAPEPAPALVPPAAGCASGSAGAGPPDEGERIAAGVVRGLGLAAASVEEVAGLLDDPAAPWDPARSALLRERAGGVLGDLRRLPRLLPPAIDGDPGLASRAAEVWT
jgi:uncharacterized repeat protein (TIGR03917 family)